MFSNPAINLHPLDQRVVNRDNQRGWPPEVNSRRHWTSSWT